MRRRGQQISTSNTFYALIAVAVVIIVIGGAVVYFGGVKRTADIFIPQFKDPDVSLKDVEIIRFYKIDNAVQYWSGIEWINIDDITIIEIGEREASKKDVYDAYDNFYYRRPAEESRDLVIPAGGNTITELTLIPELLEREGIGTVRSFVIFILKEGSLETEYILNYDNKLYAGKSGGGYELQGVRFGVVERWRDDKLKKPMPLFDKFYCIEERDDSLIVFLRNAVGQNAEC